MKLYSKILLPALVAVFLTSCLKDTPNVDFSGIQPIIEIGTATVNSTANAPSGGLGYFSGATISTIDHTPQVGFFTVGLAAKAPLSKDITVTFGINDAARTAWNAANPDAEPYEVMPDSVYVFTATSGVIHAGTLLDTVPITFYPGKMDPTKNYMLPITITDAQGTTISGNFNTIYYHTIGNPLAGPYNWDFSRWPNQTGAGDPDITFTDVTTFIPDDPTTIEVQSGYYTGPRYVLHFENDAGTLSNFSVTMNKDDVAGMAAAGVTIFSGPEVVDADPDNLVFTLHYVAYNGSAYRYVIDKFYK